MSEIITQCCGRYLKLNCYQYACVLASCGRAKKPAGDRRATYLPLKDPFYQLNRILVVLTGYLYPEVGT